MDVKLEIEKRRMVTFLKLPSQSWFPHVFPELARKTSEARWPGSGHSLGLVSSYPIDSGRGCDQQLGRAGRLLNSSSSLFLVKLIHRCGMS